MSVLNIRKILEGVVSNTMQEEVIQERKESIMEEMDKEDILEWINNVDLTEEYERLGYRNIADLFRGMLKCKKFVSTTFLSSVVNHKYIFKNANLCVRGLYIFIHDPNSKRYIVQPWTNKELKEHKKKVSEWYKKVTKKDLEDFRKSLGYNKSELASELGIGLNTYKRVENKELKKPDNNGGVEMLYMFWNNPKKNDKKVKEENKQEISDLAFEEVKEDKIEDIINTVELEPEVEEPATRFEKNKLEGKYEESKEPSKKDLKEENKILREENNLLRGKVAALEDVIIKICTIKGI